MAQLNSRDSAYRLRYLAKRVLRTAPKTEVGQLQKIRHEWQTLKMLTLFLVSDAKNKFNIYPWHSWIARQTPTLKVVGSNPIG